MKRRRRSKNKKVVVAIAVTIIAIVLLLTWCGNSRKSKKKIAESQVAETTMEESNQEIEPLLLAIKDKQTVLDQREEELRIREESIAQREETLEQRGDIANEDQEYEETDFGMTIIPSNQRIYEYDEDKFDVYNKTKNVSSCNGFLIRKQFKEGVGPREYIILKDKKTKKYSVICFLGTEDNENLRELIVDSDTELFKVEDGYQKIFATNNVSLKEGYIIRKKDTETEEFMVLKNEKSGQNICVHFLGKN